MSNCALQNLPNLQNEEIQRMIHKAEGNAFNHIKIDYERISDQTVTRLIRMGFSLSYNGMFGLYRIAW